MLYNRGMIETPLPPAPELCATRPAVLWRKGSLGSDSDAGSRFAERLLTVVATCRQQMRPLVDFLVAAGEAALRGSAPSSLLPVQPV
jgi:transposase